MGLVASLLTTEQVQMWNVPELTAIVDLLDRASPRTRSLDVGADGALVDGVGTNRVRVGGVERLTGRDHQIAGDEVEAGSLCTIAATTGGGHPDQPRPPGRQRECDPPPARGGDGGGEHPGEWSA